jgi:broad specificity phosphatase PhoE
MKLVAGGGAGHYRWMTALTVELLLARHGQTAENADGLILGHRDPPLSEVGERQAAQLAARAAEAGIAFIWTSPLRRARQTAAVVAAAVGAEVSVLDDLIESDRGSWEGQPVLRLTQASPDLVTAFENADPDFIFPGGESIAQQVVRTRRALDVAAGGSQPALVVAHAGTIRAAILAAGRHPPPERALPHGELIALTWPAPTGRHRD